MLPSELRKSLLSPPYSPITDPNTNQSRPNSPFCSIPSSLSNIPSYTTISSPSLISSSNMMTSSTSIQNSSLSSSWFSLNNNQAPVYICELNGQKFSSVDEIFDYINQEPAQKRWFITEQVLKLRTGVLQMLEGWDEQILEKIEKDKVWKYVELDESSVKTHLAPLRLSVDWAHAEKVREN